MKKKKKLKYPIFPLSPKVKESGLLGLYSLKKKNILVLFKFWLKNPISFSACQLTGHVFADF